MAKGTKDAAEARFAKAQVRAREAAQAMNEVEAEAKRVDDNTARLKLLRLAKEAKDAEEAAVVKEAKAVEKEAKAAAKEAKATAKAAKKPGAKAKTAKSIPAGKLNASNDD